MQKTFSLMAHGGAGALDNVSSPKEAVRYLESMRVVCEFGREILSRGGSVDAMQLFRQFRGRDPEIEPLLKRRGLSAPK